MKNYLKKIVAFLMTAIMVVTMCVTAFAADQETPADPSVEPTVKVAAGTSADRGVITALGIEKESGVTVHAYQIVKADYDSDNGNFTGYSQLYKKADGSEYIADITKANADELSALAQVVKSSSVSGTVYPMAAGTGEAEKTYTATVPVGSYLILVEGAESVSYNVAVVSVYYTNESGKTILSEGEVNYLAQGNTWVKRNDKPDLTKKIVNGDNREDHNSANIGDTIKYEVTVNPVPDYRGKYPRLDVVDTLSKGLTYVEGSLKVSVAEESDGKETKTELAENTAYLKEISNYDSDKGTTIKVDFVKREAEKDAQYLLNDYVGKKIIIEYSATLNENAVLNEKGNENSATLNYSKDSNTNGEAGTDTEKTYTYTFDIKGSANGKQSWTDKLIIKTGQDQWDDQEEHVTVNKTLAGAEFTLYTDKECTKVYTNKKLDGTTHFNGVTTSGADGQLNIYGLAFGTYYLKETKAPTGYTLNSHVFKIEIKDKEWNPDHTLKSWSIKIGDKTTNTFEVNNEGVKINGTTNTIIPTEIKNTMIRELPSTGGTGTYLFTILGVMVMAAVTGMFLVSRAKDKEADK